LKDRAVSLALARAASPPDINHGNIDLSRIDLGSVRDTLLYIESDVAHAPELERLAAAIRAALTEIEKLEAKYGTKNRVAPAAVHFLPAGL
jgi:hypothetical protein